MRKRLNGGERILLAYIGDKPIGTIGYAKDNQCPKKGHINRLAVLPSFRGKDYGKALMAYAEQKLCERGVKEVELSIVKSFTHLENYYIQLGYSFLKDQKFISLPFEVRFLTKKY